MPPKNPIGFEYDSEGRARGRDPREMTVAELEAIGHQRMSPLEALRARRLDCCAGSPVEVRLCVSLNCPAWPFRMGNSPWRAPPSDAQRETARRNAARMHASSGKHPRGPASSAADTQNHPEATPEASGAPEPAETEEVA